MSSLNSSGNSSVYSPSSFFRFNLVVVISMLVQIILGTTKLLQNDTFYTIMLGDIILNKGMPEVDTLTFHEGLLYTYPHWLYDSLIYLIYQVGGFAGIYISTIVFSFILGLVVYYAYVKLYKSHFVSFLLAIAVLWMASAGLTARAQLLSYILFSLEIYFIERFLQNGKKGYLVGLLLIPLLLANLHCAVWPLFFVLLLPCLAEYLIALFVRNEPIDETSIKLDRVIIEKSPYTPWLFGVFIIAIATGLLTPLGFTPYTYLYNTYQGTTLSNISEHLPLVPKQNLHFIIFVSVTALLFGLTKVKIRLRELFLLLGLLIMSLLSVRHTILLYLLGGFVLCHLAVQFFAANNLDRIQFYERKIPTLKGAIITIILIALLSMYKFIYYNLPYDYVDRYVYPVKAVEYIKQNVDLDNSRIYADYSVGSYLEFQNIKPFIDSRADLFTEEFNKGVNIFNHYTQLVRMSIPYGVIYKKYGITHTLLAKNSFLYIHHHFDPNYQELYSDDQYAVFKVLKYEPSISLDDLEKMIMKINQENKPNRIY